MTTNFPASADSYSDVTNSVTVVDDAIINNLQDAMEAIQAFLLEGGTWIPAITGSVQGPDTITYSTQIGYYRKFGDLMFVTCDVDIATFTLGSGSGNLHITGLPSAAKNVTNLDQVLNCNYNALNIDAASEDIGAQVPYNKAYIRIVENKDSANASLISLSDCSTGFFQVQGWILTV